MNVASVSCIGRNIGPKTELIKKDGGGWKEKRQGNGSTRWQGGRAAGWQGGRVANDQHVALVGHQQRCSVLSSTDN